MERALYDPKGHPVAYIADDGERTICLWNGLAVAYIDDRLNCHGWNGQYLGWVEDGILHDAQGHVVGFVKSKYSGHSFAVPPKGLKIVNHTKYAKCPPGSRPARRPDSSRLALVDFLKAGAVDSF